MKGNEIRMMQKCILVTAVMRKEKNGGMPMRGSMAMNRDA